MTGGWADKEAPVTHAYAMKQYALSKGIPEPDISIENRSLDTVGQVVLTKTEV